MGVKMYGPKRVHPRRDLGAHQHELVVAKAEVNAPFLPLPHMPKSNRSILRERGCKSVSLDHPHVRPMTGPWYLWVGWRTIQRKTRTLGVYRYFIDTARVRTQHAARARWRPSSR